MKTRRTVALAAMALAAQMASADAKNDEEVVKRDIYGFTTSMSLAEANANAQAHDCELVRNPKPFHPHAQFDGTAYVTVCGPTSDVTSAVQLVFGIYIDKVKEIDAVIRTNGREITTSLCKQYTTNRKDCSHGGAYINIDEPDTKPLTQLWIEDKGDVTTVTLYSMDLDKEDFEAAPKQGLLR